MIQIKSHAQKVLKKIDAGENVFKMLDSAKGVDFKQEMLQETYVAKKVRKELKVERMRCPGRPRRPGN